MVCYFFLNAYLHSLILNSKVSFLYSGNYFTTVSTANVCGLNSALLWATIAKLLWNFFCMLIYFYRGIENDPYHYSNVLRIHQNVKYTTKNVSSV